MRITLDRAANLALGLAALSVAWTSLSRRELPPRGSGVAGPSSEPVSVANWRELLTGGHWIGDSTAEVVIIEFSDFECPFCARFHATADSVLQEFEGSVARYYVHYPIGSHRFAIPAARAAECGAKQGRFREIHDKLFKFQDSLGLKSWEAIAEEAGLPDLDAFSRCNGTSIEPEEVTLGRRLGDSIGVAATPTVIINGKRFAVPPYANLRREVEHLVRPGSVDG
jgi:protein-disulfide isomerase